MRPLDASHHHPWWSRILTYLLLGGLLLQGIPLTPIAHHIGSMQGEPCEEQGFCPHTQAAVCMCMHHDAASSEAPRPALRSCDGPHADAPASPFYVKALVPAPRELESPERRLAHHRAPPPLSDQLIRADIFHPPQARIG